VCVVSPDRALTLVYNLLGLGLEAGTGKCRYFWCKMCLSLGACLWLLYSGCVFARHVSGKGLKNESGNKALRMVSQGGNFQVVTKDQERMIWVNCSGESRPMRVDFLIPCSSLPLAVQEQLDPPRPARPPSTCVAELPPRDFGVVVRAGPADLPRPVRSSLSP